MAAFGYWTISNFVKLLIGHNLKCLQLVPQSKIKLTYQISLVCGGFPAIMCIAAFTFLAIALPLIAIDHLQQVRRRRIAEHNRKILLQSLYKCSS